MKILYLIFFLIVFSIGEAYRILAIFPIPSRSHQLFNTGVVRSLAKAGHDVTVFAPMEMWKNPPSNYHYFKLNSTIESLMKVNFFELKTMCQLIPVLWSFGEEMCEESLSEPGLKPFMKAKGKFDLVITESFANECFMGFSHSLDLPLIQIVSYLGSSWITDSVGAPTPYSYVYEPYMFLEAHMPFLDRVRNTIFGNVIKLARDLLYIPKIDSLMRKNFEDPDMPSIAEIETTRTSLLLMNNHETLSYAKPGMPNMVNVAGMHIEESKKLPGDLQKFMNEAKNGVIFFSMGSNVKMREMDKVKMQAFFKVFSKLNQRILWRWDENLEIPNVSKNILFSPWFPQIDILSHPNLKVFATHGGFMSTIEALDKAVPVIGFPIFADQLLNMRRFQAKGLGLVIEYENITAESLDWAFTEILKPKFRENIKKISNLFHDRERSPQETTVWWVEYIIRTHGAKHLRSPGMNQAWYQYYLIDVGLFIFLICYLYYRLLLLGYSFLFSKKQSKTKVKKQ